jgi:tetratricopeptide (TPR) repeat protein
VLGSLVVGELISLVPSDGAAGLPAFAAQGFWAERWTALAYLTLYFEKLIWPSPLLPDYHSGVIDVGSASYHLRAVLGLFLLFSSVLWLGRRLRRASCSSRVEAPAGHLLGPSFMGIALFWIALAPVCNLLLRIGTLFGERLLYFPLAFLLIAPVAVLAERRREGVRKLLPLACAALILFCVAMSAERVPDWRSNRTLFEAAVRDAPGNYHGQMSYGTTLLESDEDGDVARAREAFLAAHAIRPGAYDPLAGLGKLELEQGETERARSYFESAFDRAGPGSDDRHLAALNLAEVYRQVGRPADAEALLREALAARPDSVPALRQLGDLYSRRGEIEAALHHYRRALALERGDPALWQRAIWGHLHLGEFAMAQRLAAESPEGTFSSAFRQRLEREGIRLADATGSGPGRD